MTEDPGPTTDMPVPQADRPRVAAAEYEFDTTQNRTIGGLAAAMRVVGLFLLVLGGLYGVGAVVQAVFAYTHGVPWAFVGVLFNGLVALLLFELGVWTRAAAAEFQEIVDTAGSDITNLMEALEYLRLNYATVSLIVKVYAVLVVLTVLFGVVASLTGRG